MRDGRQPLILGIGGTSRRYSVTELALRVSLSAAERAGARVIEITGADLILPIYMPGRATQSADRLLDAMRRCDGLIIASPVYHGSISGLLKNALDYTEELRTDPRVYLDSVPVGLIACAAGGQGAGPTLATLRAITHSLRGWPTPLGVALNTAVPPFDASGQITDIKAKAQLDIVGQQVTQFALLQCMTAGSHKPQQSASQAMII